MSNEKLREKWQEAEAVSGPVLMDKLVVCDMCGKDFTEDDSTIGGIIFESKACCPECTCRMMPDIVNYSEQQYIRAQCPEDVTFADFVRNHRGPDASIEVRSFPPVSDVP